MNYEPNAREQAKMMTKVILSRETSWTMSWSVQRQINVLNMLSVDRRVDEENFCTLV